MPQLNELLSDLPERSLTTILLGALDHLVPGEWQNIRSLEDMIRSATGETDDNLIQQVGERAIRVYADESTGYQRAVQIYKLIDSASTVAGVATALNMIGDKVHFLSFLDNVTPQPETSLAVSAAVKLAGEIAAFCYCNGFPGDSVGDFVSAFGNYAKEERMRVTAFVAFDCVLPFGPMFLDKILGAVRDFDASSLPGHDKFARVAQLLPGDIGSQKDFLVKGVESVGGQLQAQAQEQGLTQESVLDKIRGYIEVSEDKLDMVAAGIDMTTNIFEHTGIQTVARRVVTRAYGEI